MAQGSVYRLHSQQDASFHVGAEARRSESSQFSGSRLLCGHNGFLALPKKHYACDHEAKQKQSEQQAVCACSPKRTLFLFLIPRLTPLQVPIRGIEVNTGEISSRPSCCGVSVITPAHKVLQRQTRQLPNRLLLICAQSWLPAGIFSRFS